MSEPTNERGFDHDELIAEIEAEVKRRRDSGDLPTGLEHDLDQIFDELVPRAGDDDFESVLDEAEQAAFIDLNVPTESRAAVLVPVKRTIRRVLLFYMDYVVRQISEFTEASTRAARILGGRVERMERRNDELRERIDTLLHELRHRDQRAAAVARSLGADPLPAWADQIVSWFEGVPGRVLHAESGRGELVSRLREAGVDAYGVEPDQSLAAEPIDDELELRPDDPADHLASAGEAAAGGVVLSGCTDRLSSSRQIELADGAARALRDGGLIALVVTDPRRWTEARSVMAADVAMGRPFHRETWSELLEARGFTDVKIEGGEDAPAYAVRARRSR